MEVMSQGEVRREKPPAHHFPISAISNLTSHDGIGLSAVRKKLAVVAASLLAGFVAACWVEPEPDFYRLITIDFEVDGQQYSRSWNVSCTAHNTGAGGMYAVSYRTVGVRLQSGAAVLFKLTGHPCYEDWRPPFNPPLSDQPERRLKQLYPYIFWLDNADNPNVLEFSPFFEYLDSNQARVRVMGLDLSESTNETVSEPVPGIGWLAKSEERRAGPDEFYFDSILVIPDFIIQKTGLANEINKMPTGASLDWGQSNPILYDEKVDAPFNGLGGVPLIPHPGPEEDVSALNPLTEEWVQNFYYDNNKICLDDQQGNNKFLFRGLPKENTPFLKSLCIDQKDFTFNGIINHGLDSTRAIILENRDVAMVQRFRWSRDSILGRVHGE